MAVRKLYIIVILLLFQISAFAKEIINNYENQYNQFVKKMNEYKPLLEKLEEYNQICEYFTRIEYLHNNCSCSSEEKEVYYIDTESKEKLRINIYNKNESLKGAYGLHATSRFFYYLDENVLFGVYIFDSKDADLLITVENTKERKIIKYLILNNKNDIKREVISY
ncbi:hypothetical protein [Treponema sp. UBA3813]|uniref:hypothetical protein n=1 Tax=Treponema sp. UBA3813 TaxID=1947715 RepID=UPI0025EC425F|nr:hypothetical protein [Treponema sp. UBA3813]